MRLVLGNKQVAINKAIALNEQLAEMVTPVKRFLVGYLFSADRRPGGVNEIKKIS
jgi:hypothetical protein